MGNGDLCEAGYRSGVGGQGRREMQMRGTEEGGMMRRTCRAGNVGLKDMRRGLVVNFSKCLGLACVVVKKRFGEPSCRGCTSLYNRLV